MGVGHFIQDGHCLYTSESRLRWTSITVENGTTKTNFVADMALDGSGRLTLEQFQVNCFLLGVRRFHGANGEREAAAYLGDYMEDENDWHKEYTVNNAPTTTDPFHPQNAFNITDESCPPQSMRQVNVVTLSRPQHPKILEEKEGALVELDRSRLNKSETINGIIFVKSCPTKGAQPFVAIHNLRLRNVKTIAGHAQRVLFATMPNCHEPGSISLVSILDELQASQPDAMIYFTAVSEIKVLHIFYEFTSGNPGIRYGKQATDVVFHTLG